MNYGYARVSSSDQNEARQIIALKEAGIQEKSIYVDKQSGKNFDRPAWKRMKRKIKKGDVLSVAQLAAIMGAKQTSNLIPLCHPLALTKVEVHCTLVDGESPACTDATHNRAVKVRATVKTTGKTGVEMEALTAVQVGLLTVYDMCKAIDKGMIIGPTYLVEKEGGKSGHFVRSFVE